MNIRSENFKLECEARYWVSIIENIYLDLEGEYQRTSPEVLSRQAAKKVIDKLIKKRGKRSVQPLLELIIFEAQKSHLLWESSLQNLI